MVLSRIFRLAVCAATLLFALSFSGGVAAEDLPRAFNGSFFETSLRAGTALSSHYDAPALTADLGVRNSFPMYLGDTRLSYRFTAAQHDEVPLQLHGAHLTLGLHPFYLALLSRGFVSHFLASLHAEIGVGGVLGMFTEEDATRAAAGLSWSLGAGFDLPITDANRGGGLWLNALYRRSWHTLPFAGDHALFLGLAWRVNGSLF